MDSGNLLKIMQNSPEQHSHLEFFDTHWNIFIIYAYLGKESL